MICVLMLLICKLPKKKRLKKKTKKLHEHDQASKDTKLHALSFTGSMFMNGHVVLTGV